MRKIFIAIVLSLFLTPGILNAEEQKSYGGFLGSYQVSTPIIPAVPATKVAPIVSLPLAGQHPAPCPEKIEKTIIKETKEVVVLPKGMKQIKSLAELKKLKKNSKIWKDWDGKIYELN